MHSDGCYSCVISYGHDHTWYLVCRFELGATLILAEDWLDSPSHEGHKDTPPSQSDEEDGLLDNSSLLPSMRIFQHECVGECWCCHPIYVGRQSLRAGCASRGSHRRKVKDKFFLFLFPSTCLPRSFSAHYRRKGSTGMFHCPLCRIECCSLAK